MLNISSVDGDADTEGIESPKSNVAARFWRNRCVEYPSTPRQLNGCGELGEGEIVDGEVRSGEM